MTGFAEKLAGGSSSVASRANHLQHNIAAPKPDFWATGNHPEVAHTVPATPG